VDLQSWNDRYRLEQELDERPTPLLIEMAARRDPGQALDLASGSGRNSLWLASHGWTVQAMDGSREAIDTLTSHAARRGLKIQTQVVDLKRPGLRLPVASFDLVAICYYLQRSLFPKAKKSVKAGGLLLAIVHTTEGEEEPTENRLRPGELADYFDGWEILHSYEGAPVDPAHKRRVAEIVARRPTSTWRL
jgi:tellurite methyltransferase